MQLDIANLEQAGIIVSYNPEEGDRGKLTITGRATLSDSMIDAFETMQRTIAGEIAGIQGFEAQRLVDRFAEEIIDTGLLNLLKIYQDK